MHIQSGSMKPDIKMDIMSHLSMRITTTVGPGDVSCDSWPYDNIVSLQALLLKQFLIFLEPDDGALVLYTRLTFNS